VSLPLRGDADEHVDLAARVHTHRGALVGTQPRALRVARYADAKPTRPLLLGLLPRSPLVVAHERERAVERSGEVCRVVGDRRPILVDEAGLIGHVGGPGEVAPPHPAALPSPPA